MMIQVVMVMTMVYGDSSYDGDDDGVYDDDDEDEDGEDESEYDFLNLRERVEMARKCLEKEEEVNKITITMKIVKQ